MEVDWVSNLAKLEPRIQGIVAFADMTNQDDMDKTFARFSNNDLVKGYRHNIQSNQPGFAVRPNFISGVKKVFAQNKHFELCITYDQLEETIDLVQELPESPLILNHCGKPNIKKGQYDPWRQQLKRLSSHQHVYCNCPVY